MHRSPEPQKQDPDEASRQLAEDLSTWLSPRAVDILREQGIRRDPKATASKDELARLAASLGLPENAAALSAEERIGGLRTDDRRVWGSFAALARTDARAVQRLGWGQLWPIEQPLSDTARTWHLLAPDGTVWLDSPDMGSRVPVASTVRILFERLATRVQLAGGDRGRVRVDFDVLAGEPLASALGLRLIAESQDAHQSEWEGEDAAVIEVRWALVGEGLYPRTELHARSLDVVVEGLRAVRASAPNVAVRVLVPQALRAPWPAREPEVARVPSWIVGGGAPTEDVVIVGSPGDYRVAASPRATKP